jgi:hypothetical protein
MIMKDLPLKVTRQFRRLLDIEMAGDRERKRDTYSTIMYDLAIWLHRDLYELTPLHIENEHPPAWVDHPMLALMFDRAHLAWARIQSYKKSA